MNTVQSLLHPPSWAYDLCYYYLAGAVLIVVANVVLLVQILTAPSAFKKVIPLVGIVISVVLSTGIAVLMALMEFWVCRSALRPSVEKMSSGTGAQIPETSEKDTEKKPAVEQNHTMGMTAFGDEQFIGF
jgi:hypothetical protein